MQVGKPSGTVRPLNGIRVLAAEHLVAAPYSTMLLADMDAEAIRVEPPKVGEIGRHMGPFVAAANGETVAGTYLRANRNKKAITLDLRSRSSAEHVGGNRARRGLDQDGG